MADPDRPRYVIPWRIRLMGGWRLLAGRPISASGDMTQLLAGAPRPPVAVNPEAIPAAGSLLITQNHDCRHHLGAWWGTALVLTAVAARRGAVPIGMVTSEWYYLDRWRSATLTPLTRWILGRAARVWNFQPLPPDARALAPRAAAVRRTLHEATTLFGGGGALGIAPEGQGEDGLIEPLRGAGRFLLRLAANVPVLPVGIYETAGRLTARFGAPYRLSARPDEDKRAEDDRISREVMTAIAALLPPAARGLYG